MLVPDMFDRVASHAICRDAAAATENPGLEWTQEFPRDTIPLAALMRPDGSQGMHWLHVRR